MNNPPVDIVDRVKVVEVEDDWCDTCGSRAYVYAKMPSGRTVTYCAHHGTVYWDRLNAQASIVIDHRDHV